MSASSDGMVRCVLNGEHVLWPESDDELTDLLVDWMMGAPSLV